MAKYPLLYYGEPSTEIGTISFTEQQRNFMDFTVISQKQWRTLSDLQSSTSQIREKRSTVIGLFAELAASSTMLGAGAVSGER